MDGKYERTFLKKANVPIDGQPYSIYLHHRRKALGEARNGLKVLLQLRGLGQGAKNIAQISAFFLDGRKKIGILTRPIWSPQSGLP